MKFSEHGFIVHVEIDPTEIGRDRTCANGHRGQRRAGPFGASRAGARALPPRVDFSAWRAQIEDWKREAPFRYDQADEDVDCSHLGAGVRSADIVPPPLVIERLYALHERPGYHHHWGRPAPDVGRAVLPVHLAATFSDQRGLGAMGFGYPAAIGAKIARPDLQVIDIDGDGSFLMNVHELATAKRSIAAKAIVLDNQHLGMVVQMETFTPVRARTRSLENPARPGVAYPDLPAMVQSFGVPCESILGGVTSWTPQSSACWRPTGPMFSTSCSPYTPHVLPFIPSWRGCRSCATNRRLIDLPETKTKKSPNIKQTRMRPPDTSGR